MVWQGTTAEITTVAALLDAARLCGRVGHHSALDQQVTATGAAGFEPPPVQTEQVGIGAAGGPLADFGQHIDESDEVVSQFGED